MLKEKTRTEEIFDRILQPLTEAQSLYKLGNIAELERKKREVHERLRKYSGENPILEEMFERSSDKYNWRNSFEDYLQLLEKLKKEYRIGEGLHEFRKETRKEKTTESKLSKIRGEESAKSWELAKKILKEKEDK